MTGITSDGRELSPVSVQNLVHPVLLKKISNTYIWGDDLKIHLRNGGSTYLWQEQTTFTYRNGNSFRPIALRGENYLSVQNVTTISAAPEVLNTPSVLNIPNR